MAKAKPDCPYSTAEEKAKMIEGKTIEEAWNISPGDVVDYLEPLPEDESYCAELAVGAFYLALSDSEVTKKTPWKTEG